VEISSALLRKCPLWHKNQIDAVIEEINVIGKDFDFEDVD
jgi:hypothetical protein